MPDNYSPQANPSTPPGRKTARTAAPSAPTFAEPLKVAEFWKNRRGESIRVSLSTYEGRAHHSPLVHDFHNTIVC